MKEDIKRSIKRWLKRKITITLGMMIAFMITGGVVYSNDGVINTSVNIKVVDGEIIAEINGVQTEIGNTWTNNAKVEVAEGNGVIIENSVTEDMNFSLVNSGVISGSNNSSNFKGNGIYNKGGIIENLTNNGIISGSNILGIYANGTGIYNESGTIRNLINSGVISGNGSSDNYSGNGIYNESGRIENLTNNGIISGSNNILGYDSGNGIYNRSEIIENLINNGIISSSGLGKGSGNGVYNNYGTIENLINNGIISVDSSSLEKFDGNGIVNNGGIIENLTNSGVISGDNNSSEANSGNGIYNYLRTIESLINNGIISGKSSNLSESSGTGIYTLESKINLLNNNGIISGESNNSDWYSGNGIHNYTGTIENLANNGLILGESSDVERCLGNGIYNYVGTIGNLINNGIISGSSNKIGYRSGNGIDNYQGTITKLINYGIIAGSNKAINTEDGIIITQNNYGLLIDGEGKTDDTFKIVVGESKKIEDVEYAGYEIKNTFTKGEYKYSGIASEIDITLSDTDNKDKLIINGYNKGLKVDKDLTLSNSIVNSYTTAINIDGGNFIGENIIINGGIDETSTTIKGSANADNLTLTGNSIINGNIDMGDGADTISLTSSTLNGDITAGGDTITMNTSTINGNSNLTNSNMDLTTTTLNGDITASGGKIDISGTANRLFNVGATTINGDITLTDGEIYVSVGSIINGDITLNGGKATVWLDKNQAINGNITIDSSVAEKTLGLNYNVNFDEEMTSLKNQTDKFTGFDVKLKDGGNTITLIDLNISSITGGSGVDVFKSTITEFAGKTIDGGEGSDTLALTDNITEGNQVDFSKVKNVENLQLADGGNTLDVHVSPFTTIIGGSGDDNFTNVGSTILFGIKGGEGTDTITMNKVLYLSNDEVNTIFDTNSIEQLNLDNSINNEIFLDELTHLSKINFGTNGSNILNLGRGSSGIEFDFTQKNLINGNVKVDLHGNIAILNSISSGNTVTISKDFMVGDSNVILYGNTIKLNLSQDTDFSKGIETTLTLDKNGVLGGDTTVETYAFLRTDGDTITVKDWKELSGDINATDTDSIIYNSIVKDFNKDGVYGALTKWESDSIVNWIENGGFTLGDYTFQDNKEQYNGIVSSGTLTVDTGVGGELQGFSIEDLSSKGFVIKNNTQNGDETVTFTGDTVVDGNIVNNSSENTKLVFGGTTTVGNIDSSKSTASTTIDIDNKFSSGNIIFNGQDNKLNIDNSSNVNSIGTISGKVDITIDTIGENSDGFDKVLTGANAGLSESKDNNSITVTNQANGLELDTEYNGTLTFNGADNNIILGSNIANLVMGSGADIINLDTSKFEDEIFVNVDGKDGDDIFNIGSHIFTLENSINQKLAGKTLTGTINSFEEININESINLASDLEITGANKITIGAGKELGLNVDYTKTEDGKVTGHALYDNGIEVNNNSGKIVVGTSTANEDRVISMGNGDTASTITNGENIVMSESINHSVEYDKTNNELEVKVKKDLELGKNENVKYSHLNKIYQSIVDAGKIALMSPSSTLIDKTEDEAIKAQLEFYGKIYNSTPYAYSNDISRETANMVNNSIMDSRFKANEGSWLHYGAIAGQGYDDDNSYYGRGYYNSVDLGIAEVDIESDIYSAYYMGEYGKTDKLALGYVIAGNNSNTDIGESDLKGSGYYLGAYTKYSAGNLRLIAGLGYQHNYYKADRRVSNKYQLMTIWKKYTDDTLTAYSGVKYIHNLTDDLTVEPYARVSLAQVMQHSINEADNGDLSISVDGKGFTTLDSEIGVDLVKSTVVKDGKVNLIAGVGAEIMLDGYGRENLTAKVNGSSKTFDIISEKEENFRGKVSLGVEYEKTNGVFYNAKGSYIRTEDNDNCNLGIGIGYKF